MITKTCIICNKSFTVHNYRVNTAKFCSKECSCEVKKRIVHKKCSLCGKSFSTVPSSKKVYCSNKCRGLSDRISIKKQCLICKKEIEVKPSLIERKKYCSKECMNKALIIKNKGENNPFYGKTHTKKVREKLKRLYSGKKKPFHLCNRKPVISGSGYIHIFKPNHPFCKKDGYVRQSRLVMEKHLNRYISPNEVIHHINRIRTDDRIENLKLFYNNSEHIKYHRYKKKDW